MKRHVIELIRDAAFAIILAAWIWAMIHGIVYS